MTKLALSFFAILAFFLGSAVTRAGDTAARYFDKTVVHEGESPFEKGDWENQALVGAFIGIERNTSSKRPNSSDVDGNIRLGVMLSNVKYSGLLRGNYQLLLDAFGAGIFEGPGGVLAGANLLLRYNFVQPHSPWIPYLQIGAGGLYNDVYKNHTQRVLGSAFEFNLQASLGLRYMLNEKWALDVEGGYRHISNADTAARNLGLNSLGGLLGVSYFF